jgi:hypothetical protein
MTLSGKIARTTAPPVTSHDKTRGRTHQWKCVYDPTASKVFFGNFFRTIDVSEGGFPFGTVFENIKTGKRITQR